MPYCEEHNEVYRADECPVCASEGGAGSTSADDAVDTPSSDSVDELVDDIVDSVQNEASVDGDAVIGSQEKSVEKTDVTQIDNSTEIIDESTEVNDESTTVSDSVVKDSDIGTAGGGTEVEDSVVSDSSVGGGKREQNETSSKTPQTGTSTDPSRRETGSQSRLGETPNSGRSAPSNTAHRSDGPAPQETTTEPTQHCIFCGEEIPASAGHCPSCGEELPE